MATCVCVDALAVNVVLLLWLMLSPVVFRWRAWDCVLCCVLCVCAGVVFWCWCCVLVLSCWYRVLVMVLCAGIDDVCWCWCCMLVFVLCVGVGVVCLSAAFYVVGCCFLFCGLSPIRVMVPYYGRTAHIQVQAQGTASG